MIRVLIVDDMEMVRLGLAIFVETCHDMVLVGEASDGEEALARAAELTPDVILLDLHLPGLDGLTVLRHLKQRQPATQIVVLSASVDGLARETALALGAASFVAKTTSLEALAEAIRAADPAANGASGGN